MRRRSRPVWAWFWAVWTTVVVTTSVGAADKPGLKVTVSTDRADALYRCGEKVVFTVKLANGEETVTSGNVVVVLTLDGGKTLKRETLDLASPPATVSGTLSQPGFLRCHASYSADGKRGRGLGGAGFEPERIRTTATIPDDFAEFWEAGRAKQLELAPELTLTPLPNASNATVTAFKISFPNLHGTTSFGFLGVPKGKDGPFPAYVSVPGAGPGPTGPGGAKSWATRGALGLTMSVHAYDPTQPVADIKAQYEALNAETRYAWQGAPDRDAYYFRRAIVAVDRAINYVASRPDFDGKHFVVDGSSQGGAFALIMAGLNPHVTACAANVPAMCDHRGAEVERGPGWPGLLRAAGGEDTQPFALMSSYFDAVNFARRISCPTIVSVGFIDGSCSPSSVMSVYNEIRAPKQLFPDPRAGHQWVVGQFRTHLSTWIPGQLGLQTPVAPMKGQ